MTDANENRRTIVHVKQLHHSLNRTCQRLLLAAACVFFPGTIVGCASVTDDPTTGHPSLAFQSYDLPAALEANKVIEAAEQSFMRVLSSPPRMTEGSVPSPLPAAAPDFAIEERQVELDRLGIVKIPTVVCPHNLALLHGFGQAIQRSLPFRYTGCIQFYAGGYRVHFVASAMLATSSVQGQDREMQETLQRLGGHFAEQFAEVRIAASSHEQLPAGGGDGIQTASVDGAMTTRGGKLPVVQAAGLSAGEMQNARQAVAALPLVCLAASTTSAAIRSERGAGRIVGTLEPGAVVAVMEPADPSYFWVNTEERRTGWVNHVDVKRLRCPVG